MQVRERLFGGHPVNSPRSAMRVDTSARFHRPRPLSRVGGLLPGSGVDEVVVEMDQSPAPVSAARSVKASRVSRAHAEPDTLEEQDETEEDNGAATGGKALNSDGGNDEWIDQDAIESGGSGKASLSPPLLTSASSKAEAAGKGVDLRAWRGRTDDTEVEDDSEDAHDSATRNPRRNLNLCGFDSDVAMESPIVNKLRQDHRRSLMGLQSRRSAEVVQNVCAKDGMELDSPARVLGRDFGRMLLSEKTPPVAFPSAASSEQRSGSKDLHTESGSEVKSAASSSSAGASPALNASDEDLPSPFIKRVSRLESPPSSSAGTEQPGETSKYPIRSSSAHNLLAKAVAGSAAAAQKAANERRQGAGGLSKQSSASDLADDIENQRPGGVKSLYPPLPVSGQAVTSDRTSALQAIRARRQSVASGLVLGTSSIAPISLSSAPLKTAASSGTRPSATLARRLSAAAGAEPRAQASTLKSTGLKPVQPQGAPNSRVVTGTSIRGKMSSVSTAGGPNASRSSNAFPGRVLSSAAKPSTNSNVGSATTGFGGNNLLIPGASRRRSLMHSRDT
ncbi:hypothetical protein OC861_001278 [Tilletia horrida]|nr:hypothetical protein OC861_001278 [Tilletia horrida]